MKKPKISIIGAGLAGLTAAYRLQEKGFEVEIFEARKRVGGRVLTASINGHIGELGGQNIRDGGEAKSLLALACELGLKTRLRTLQWRLRYFDSKTWYNVSDLLEGFTWDKEQLISLAQKERSLDQVLRIFFKNRPTLYKAFSIFFAGYEGATAQRLSSCHVDTLYYLLNGGVSFIHNKSEVEHLSIVGGNGLLAEKLSKNLSVHFDHALKSIKKDPLGKYQLQFRNGDCTKADYVILAIPTTTYEDICIDETVIPADRKKTIENIEFGKNSKILVPVPPLTSEKFQYANDRMAVFLNDDCHIANMYFIDPYGKFDAQSIRMVYENELPLMSAAYHIKKSLHPVLARDEPFASYRGPVGYSWPSDPFAKGSYSCFGVGQQHILSETENVRGEEVKSLFAPIDNSLFFAGEHTAISFDILGTMEAAVESGERVSHLISISN